MAEKYGRCKAKQHDLQEILSSHVTASVYNVVRWCTVCGAVVVDTDYDGIARARVGNIMRMQTPQIADEYIFTEVS